jgi:phosphoribosylanthranilate isomerase
MKRILKRVTITGADDKVNPRYLYEISQEFPFVEWGILVSKNSAGFSRFPSMQWIHELETAQAKLRVTINLSMHLCGTWLRQLLSVSNPEIFSNAISEELTIFNRVQLNFHAEKQLVNLSIGHNLRKFGDMQIIFQMDGVNEGLYHEAKESKLNVVPFYDTSHGAGKLRDVWNTPNERCYGLAGGLTPYNLDENLTKISETCAVPIWIDTETGVRGNSYAKDDVDNFNMHKVWKFLSVAEKWVIK